MSLPRFNQRYRRERVNKAHEVIKLLDQHATPTATTTSPPPPPSAEKPENTDYLSIMRRGMAQQDGENDTIWLLSYADLITLLFGFFVMLMTFSKLDSDTFEKARRETTRFFGGEYELPMQKLKAEISKQMEQQRLAEQVHFDLDSRGLSVTFRGALFFDPASADLRPEADRLIQQILPVIKNMGDDIKIIIEGHTDDSPISDERFPSNWELSSYRASRVLRLLEGLGVPKRQLRAIGFGDSMPAYPNRDDKGNAIPENQTRNRRVVLRVMRSSEK